MFASHCMAGVGSQIGLGDTQGMLCYITSQPIGNDCFALFIYVYILVRAGIGIFEAEGWLFYSRDREA